ncbi:MAG: pyridoxamine 5'-phosphate oxidase family protein [Streptosporangiaceae bacterium]|jgi:nitroimidazol reductase NimA-like FMN-containing flavoprotein (pyridoxamine 5'-phosphate oxidase superfamily)
MNAPVTELDQRFSAPDAVAAGWEQTRSTLAEAELFWICSVRTDGRPHVTPLVAVWFGEAIHFCTGEAEQKAVNLRNNPHVILMAGSGRWEEGLDVVVEGDAVPVTDDAMLRSLASAWTGKWDGRWQYEVGEGGFQQRGAKVLVFSVTPAKVLAFAQGHFAQTRHTFP